jgi:hypothetical protein
MSVTSSDGWLRRVLGVLTVGMVALTLVSAGHSYLSYEPVEAVEVEEAEEPASRTTTGEPAVVATIDGVGPGQLVAYDDDGRVVYRNESLWIYHDVDPSPRGSHTVTYVASDPAGSDACDADGCLRNVIERVNLTTGNVTRVHAWVDARTGSTQTHDVDRVNESVYLVADISYPDRVYMVDVTTGEELWEWRVSRAYEPESGGDYPSDWTHINDVEYLPDGRVMANLRNQDQVVFVEPGEGVQANWTLGADGEHATLFEAHNPDYIPASRGGPAVVVADSENNRLVEYQREDGSWERTWHWQDTTMQWPRDADRLPSGRTLVADSHGQRLLSVDTRGRVVWSQPFPTGSYDVELLGTGDESAGGRSATSLGLRSRWPGAGVDDGNTSMADATVGGGTVDTDTDTADGGDAESDTPASDAAAEQGLPGLSVLVYGVVSLVPPLVLHGLLYTLPPWATPVDATLVVATVGVGACWLAVAVTTRLASRVGVRRG